MAEEHSAEFARLRARGDALTAEFEAVKRDHEVGLIPYEDALARHKAITEETHVVAARMRDLVPEKSNPTPTDSN